MRLLVALMGCYLLFYTAQAQPRFVTLDSTKIWLNTLGFENRTEGQPAVIFESGLGTPMGNWDRVIKKVAAMTPVVTYDRPGIGESEADDALPTVKYVADQLVKLLQQLEIAPPYVLVGHSLGGVYVRGFANHYPELLAGAIMVDPADFTETQQNKRDYYEVLNWTEAQVDQKLEEIKQLNNKRRKGAPRSIIEEGDVLGALRLDDFKALNATPLPDIPVHILTGGRFDMPQKMRSKEYDEEALFRSKMRHRVARWTDVIQSVSKGMLFYSGDAGHFVQWDDPDLVVASIRLVLSDYALMQSGNK